jgi:UDP-N-acetylmuramyl pentapeptide phosphotransferase/UDP-N-acetylglucosamine-1-phosphate transferase
MTDGALIVAGLVALGVAVIVTRLVELVARRRSLFDVPNQRSLHETPTPRLGGLGIVAGTSVGYLIAGGARDEQTLAILAIGLGIAAVGLVDDFVRISVAAKYGAQLAAALAGALVAGAALDFQLAGASVSVSGWPATIIAAIWLTALINAFNFMDGIDGMTGGVAAVTAVVGIGLAGASGDLVLISIAGACLGFLIWNHHPASIFMGDVGSQFLGYLVGVCVLLQPGGVVGVVPVLIIVSPFLIDTGVTLVRRALAGRNVFAGHREHLYQRLVLSGADHRAVAAGYAVATAVAGMLALAWSSGAALQVGAVVGVAAAAVGYVLWVSAAERGTLSDR